MEPLTRLIFGQMLKEELAQLKEEGKYTEQLAQKIDDIVKLPDHQVYSAAFGLYDQIADTPVRSGFGYEEPAEFARIISGITSFTAREINEQTLYDRIYGGWLGRCAGCLLGKPVEGWSAKQIETMLKWKEKYPLDAYVAQEKGLPPELGLTIWNKLHYDTGTVEKDTQMLRDDDIDYTILGMLALEEYGRSFTSFDMISMWLYYMPIRMTYTAEWIAYRNIVNGLNPPQSGFLLNPYREWIGAQIRADIWGFVNPDNPAKAAEFAYRDAVVSHQKNGVYGEMFVAAAIAAAFKAGSVEDALKIGLSAIPSKSRLAEAIEKVMMWSRADSDWQQTLEKLMSEFGHYHLIHTIPNAAIVAMALLHGNGDFEKSISISVMAGLDTDCNGATVGSILGVYLGAQQLPARWLDPLNDRVSTALCGMSDMSISDLARRTVKIAKTPES